MKADISVARSLAGASLFDGWLVAGDRAALVHIRAKSSTFFAQEMAFD